jgi:outer membrane biosynthesis protein TonB
MTLAAFLLGSILGTSLALPWITSISQSAPAASANQTSNAAETQSKEATPPAQTPANTSQPPSATPPAKTSSGQNVPKTPKPRHKKKVVPSDCKNAPAAVGQASPDSSSPNPAAADPPATGNAPAPGTASTPTNCPPSKVIVKQGGSSEPSIQLAGGAGGKQTSQERDTAKEMLGTTEANLKQIAGRQLSSAQQDMVTQIRQFMEQSKAAVADGDLDRARTLAWKAQVLSQELVKPSQ